MPGQAAATVQVEGPPTQTALSNSLLCAPKHPPLCLTSLTLEAAHLVWRVQEARLANRHPFPANSSCHAACGFLSCGPMLNALGLEGLGQVSVSSLRQPQ